MPAMVPMCIRCSISPSFALLSTVYIHAFTGVRVRKRRPARPSTQALVLAASASCVLRRPECTDTCTSSKPADTSICATFSDCTMRAFVVMETYRPLALA